VRCGAALQDTWATESRLCMSCDLAVELGNRARRWQALSA
jgi:hypothetical protein